MKRLILTNLALLVLLNCHAIDIDYSNNGKIAAGMRLGMSLSPSVDAEISVEYRPFRYLGAKVGIMLITPFNYSDNVVQDIPIIDHQYKEIKNNNECLYRTAVSAGLQFTTPAVMLTKGEMGLSLRLSPGIIMPFPTNKRVKVLSAIVTSDMVDVDGKVNKDNILFYSEEYHDNSGAKFCYWYGRAELVVEYEEKWEFAIGYTYSNLDIYGGARDITINDTPIVTGNKKNFQSITLGLTYKF